MAVPLSFSAPSPVQLWKLPLISRRGTLLGDTGISDVRQDIANDYEQQSKDLKLTLQLPKLSNIRVPLDSNAPVPKY